MEYKKDIKTHSRTQSQNIQQRNFDSTSPFGKNYASAYAYRRTEKVLIALYLVTNFVPENEPARIFVRDKALNVLSEVLSLRIGFRSAGAEKVNTIIASLNEIISLLDIIHATGYISDMNLEVLKGELISLILFLRSVEDDSSAQSIHLTDSYFDTDESIEYKGHLKGHIEKDIMSDIKKTLDKDKKTKGQISSRTIKESVTVKKHSNRREQIISLLKDKKFVTVKDVSEIIVNCGEKTIQRELMSLVNSGVLKKEGERRWSTYSFA